MSVSIEVDADFSALGAKLQEISASLTDMTPAFNEVGMAVEQLVILGFVDSTDPYGQVWASISHRQGLPLVDTGRLKGSITHQATANSAIIGTNVSYAPYHQLGWGVKQRKFLPDLGLPVSWETEIMATLDDYIQVVLNG